MIRFSTCPSATSPALDFSTTSTVTSQIGRYYSAATVAPVWATLHTRTAQTGTGWLLTRPANVALLGSAAQANELF